LKHDELSDRLAIYLARIFKYRKLIISGAILVAAILIISLSGYFYIRSQQGAASDALAQALTSFHAPVIAEPPPGTTMLSFPSDEEKFQQAFTEFTDVADSYSGYAAGHFARYYTALCQREMNQRAEAELAFQTLTYDSNAEVASLARLSLADLYATDNRETEAISLLQELADTPTDVVPRTRAQFELADLLEQSDPATAATLYREIQDAYAGTLIAEQAMQRLEQLPQH
jgi:hypothetical protein